MRSRNDELRDSLGIRFVRIQYWIVNECDVALRSKVAVVFLYCGGYVGGGACVIRAPGVFLGVNLSSHHRSI